MYFSEPAVSHIFTCSDDIHCYCVMCMGIAIEQPLCMGIAIEEPLCIEQPLCMGIAIEEPLCYRATIVHIEYRRHKRNRED